MNKNIEKYTRRQGRKNMKALNLLSPEQLEDCTNRDMSQSFGSIKQYLWEVKEVEEATRRMKDIDAKIATLPMSERLKREDRLERQRYSLVIQGVLVGEGLDEVKRLEGANLI
jgi:hypothetical protein